MGEEVVEEKEPFEINGLCRYHIENTLCEKILTNKDIYDTRAWIKAGGDLPHGAMGECVFEELRANAENFAGRIRDYGKFSRLDPLEIDIDVSGLIITGHLDNIFTEHLLFYRCANIKPSDLLKAWISHLAMIITGKSGYPDKTFVIGKDKTRKYSPLSQKDAEKIVKGIVEIYLKGMRRPVSFFPFSSFAYARFISEKGEDKKEDALEKAEKEWKSGFYPGEEENVNYKRCFGHKENPLDEEFRAFSLKIFGPLCQNMEPVK